MHSFIDTRVDEISDAFTCVHKYTHIHIHTHTHAYTPWPDHVCHAPVLVLRVSAVRSEKGLPSAHVVHESRFCLYVHVYMCVCV
jgi:hypothetical protein